MRTAVIAIAKLENNYVREWTEWYKNLGFTNVIIYDNNDLGGERISDAISDYIVDGFAIVEPFYDIEQCQAKAYQNGYDKYGTYYDWIAFFDIDEYLVLNDRFENNIENYLSMGCFKGRDCIRVTWKMYGDSGLVRVKDGDYSIMKRFIIPSKRNYTWTKAIVHGGIDGLKVPQYGDGQAHLVRVKEIRDAVDANGIPVKNTSIRNGCGYENAALNHYSTKTIEEFVTNKIKKGYAEGSDPQKLNMDHFFDQNDKTDEKVAVYNELLGISDVNEKKIALYTMCDDKYLEHTKTMLYSFLYNNKWFGGDIVILCDEGRRCGLSQESRDSLKSLYKNVVIEEIDSSSYNKLIDNAHKQGYALRYCYFSSVIYYKMDVFKQNQYDIKVYLDSDTIVCDDISELFSNDSENVLVVEDGDKPNTNYFNAGVLSIPMRKMPEGFYEKLIEFGENYELSWYKHPASNKAVSLDQDILNELLENKTFISSVYNTSPHFADRSYDMLQKVKIIHYYGAYKPWKENSEFLPLLLPYYRYNHYLTHNFKK